MPKKRKTLPVVQLCEAKAYSGSRHNALYFPGMTVEMVRWLLGQGLNINTEDHAVGSEDFFM